jgi:8-oxo-dGTP pyrophosphatase MutT (NUDIX family)
MKKSLLPRILETKQLYQNPHVTCCIDTVSRGTNTWEQFYFYGTLPVSGAFVVPFEDKYIYMLQQHRYASNQYFWEFPGGKVEEGEDLAKTALRELQEEAGITSAHLELIAHYEPLPNLFKGKIALFTASHLSSFTRSLDHTESIGEIRRFLSDEIDEMIANGQICSAQTITQWTLFKRHFIRSKSII